MSEKILFVDDEQNVLEGYRRNLRKDFDIETANGGVEALKMLKGGASFAVIVSDMRMPEIDGVQLLSQAAQLYPDTVRIMLTGNTDQQTAVDALTEGKIFRFLNKPCPTEKMARNLQMALEHHRLVRAEKDLLEKTLSGSVQALTEILSMTNPTAFGRSTRVRHLVRQLSGILKIKDGWQTELAAMLSQIGCITIPEEILLKVYSGREFTPQEYQMIQSHPQVGHDLVVNIPRLEMVAEIILYQEKRYNGGGFPYNGKQGEDIPFGARILKVALDFDKLTQGKITHTQAYTEMEMRDDWYDLKVINALRQTIGAEIKYETKVMKVNDLRPGMLLAEDVITNKGMLLISAGNEITTSVCLRMRNFFECGILKEEVNVLLPKADD